MRHPDRICGCRKLAASRPPFVPPPPPRRPSCRHRRRVAKRRPPYKSASANPSRSSPWRRGLPPTPIAYSHASINTWRYLHRARGHTIHDIQSNHYRRNRHGRGRCPTRMSEPSRSRTDFGHQSETGRPIAPKTARNHSCGFLQSGAH